MISNLEKEITDYQNNNTEENKLKLIESLIKLDKEITKNYLEELKKYTQKCIIIEEELKRLNKIINIIEKRTQERQNLLIKTKELSLEITYPNIPNLDKLKSFSNKAKVIETLLNITTKINKNNKNKALEILNRKEFKLVLLEFSLIKNETYEEIENYINSIITKIPKETTPKVIKENIPKVSLENTSQNLKILEYYYHNQKYFPNLTIPNMGLESNDQEITINNNTFFLN